MQLSNYHSHCTFCDGRSAPEEFIRFALARGFRAYGFSSHSPLPFETFWNMSASDFPEYLQEIGRLKRKYAGQLEIYTGLEIDYLDETYNPSIPYFREMPLDYRIGSIHFLPLSPVLEEANMVCIDGPFEEYKAAVDRYFNGDIQQLVRRFYASTMRMIEAGGFDIVGHIDKIRMNGNRFTPFSMEDLWYHTLFYDCLALIAEKGLMVEVNTKNMQRKQELFPHHEYLSTLRKFDIPVVVNSDCHFPDLVNDGREAAFGLLRLAGYRTTRELVDGRWEDVPF